MVKLLNRVFDINFFSKSVPYINWNGKDCNKYMLLEPNMF